MKTTAPSDWPKVLLCPRDRRKYRTPLRYLILVTASTNALDYMITAGADDCMVVNNLADMNHDLTASVV
jgi:hypothetical protein